MKVISSVFEIKAWLKPPYLSHKSIGFVPTMGFLHEGHLSLVRQARADNDISIVSIFVNPAQFGAHEDFEKYPRDFNHDCSMLEKERIDVVFAPTVEEMYPEGFKSKKNSFDTSQSVKLLMSCLCGTFRSGHFEGVIQVVERLFQIVQPTRVYFGQKDYQQYLIIKKFIEKHHLPVEIIGCPIVREHDGLAMSSRNVYLSAEEREKAAQIYQALMTMRRLYHQGQRDALFLQELLRSMLLLEPAFILDYAEIRDRETLESIVSISHPAIVAVALHLGKTRLIDNIILETVEKVASGS